MPAGTDQNRPTFNPRAPRNSRAALCFTASIALHGVALAGFSYLTLSMIRTPPEALFRLGSDAVAIDISGIDAPKPEPTANAAPVADSPEPDITSLPPVEPAPSLVTETQPTELPVAEAPPPIAVAIEQADPSPVTPEAPEITVAVTPVPTLRPIETVQRARAALLETVEVSSTHLSTAVAILAEVQRATADARKRGAPGMLRPDEPGEAPKATSKSAHNPTNKIGPAGASSANAVPGVASGIKSIRLPSPKYPLASRRAGEQGVVVLQVQVLEDGRVGEVVVETEPGFPRLVQAAIAAVREARFEPAKADGKPIRDTARIPFRFRLDGRE